MHFEAEILSLALVFVPVVNAQGLADINFLITSSAEIAGHVVSHLIFSVPVGFTIRRVFQNELLEGTTVYQMHKLTKAERKENISLNKTKSLLRCSANIDIGSNRRMIPTEENTCSSELHCRVFGAL